MSEHGGENGDDDIFGKALTAAMNAFQQTIDDHFGRTFDGSEEDEARLMQEYRESADRLRQGTGARLRTGLIDADFVCWHSNLADENFGPGHDENPAQPSEEED